MDRFGVDLIEEVLQYLTFEDKIRLECVSKQWKRCVFQRQFVIRIDYSRDRKCQNSLNGLFRPGIANGPTSKGGYREGGKLRGGLAG